MKLAIIKVINGNYFIHAEGITSLESAKTQYHGLCQTLWNAPDVLDAHVMIADEQPSTQSSCSSAIKTWASRTSGAFQRVWHRPWYCVLADSREVMPSAWMK